MGTCLSSKNKKIPNQIVIPPRQMDENSTEELSPGTIRTLKKLAVLANLQREESKTPVNSPEYLFVHRKLNINKHALGTIHYHSPLLLPTGKLTSTKNENDIRMSD